MGFRASGYQYQPTSAMDRQIDTSFSRKTKKYKHKMYNIAMQ